jgi:hypothetical protein
MIRILYLTICLALAARCDAQALGGIAGVTIVDRDSGAVLRPHFYRGEYWVAGRPGARYAIEIRNRLGERLLAVTSVDGINVVSGATAAWDQPGYVFGPGERYQITGWRKSDADVAAFTFTDSSNSYAQRIGRPANVGVIGVAIFRERPPQPLYAPPMIAQPPVGPVAPTESDSSSAASGQAQNAPAILSSPSLQRAPSTASKLGTGHGEREYSYVRQTEFVRMQTQPNEVIRIRYDSLDNLLAMGVIKRAPSAPPIANPFPASPEQQYVPDPPG